MGIFEIATQLGEELKKDERLVRLEAAKKAYEENAALQKQLVEFEVQQRAMQQEIVKEEKDMQFIDNDFIWFYGFVVATGVWTVFAMCDDILEIFWE